MFDFECWQLTLCSDAHLLTKLPEQRTWLPDFSISLSLESIACHTPSAVKAEARPVAGIKGSIILWHWRTTGTGIAARDTTLHTFILFVCLGFMMPPAWWNQWKAPDQPNCKKVESHQELLLRDVSFSRIQSDFRGSSPATMWDLERGASTPSVPMLCRASPLSDR